MSDFVEERVYDAAREPIYKICFECPYGDCKYETATACPLARKERNAKKLNNKKRMKDRE